MMQRMNRLLAREENDGGLSEATVDLLISLLVLVLFGIVLIGCLLFLRRRRLSRQTPELPVHNGQCAPHHRSMEIISHSKKGSESLFVIEERTKFMENSSSPPPSPVPEIRITFPEEEDDSGKRQSGKVVVVRIGECGSVGLEPYHEQLPPYQTSDADRFQSLDIERIGGLKDKEDAKRWG
ncbi:hypothetical protein BDV19DRAFT_366469 [Aspergillus venezuelensis]